MPITLRERSAKNSCRLKFQLGDNLLVPSVQLAPNFLNPVGAKFQLGAKVSEAFFCFLLPADS